METGLKLCDTVHPDLMLGTDPDCDRMGAAVPDGQGGYRLITGNEMGALLLDLYDRGEIQRLYVVYTEMGDGMDLIVHADCLLPIYPETFAQDGQEENELRFEPSADAVLARAIPSYVTGYLYSAVVESFCAEQSARTSAMDLANQNAQELLEELTAEYNHERQSAITQEITEISAGERAEKQHAKERRSHE